MSRCAERKKDLLSERSICLGEKAENLRENVDFINVAPGLIRWSTRLFLFYFLQMVSIIFSYLLSWTASTCRSTVCGSFLFVQKRRNWVGWLVIQLSFNFRWECKCGVVELPCFGKPNMKPTYFLCWKELKFNNTFGTIYRTITTCKLIHFPIYQNCLWSYNSRPPSFYWLHRSSIINWN